MYNGICLCYNGGNNCMGLFNRESEEKKMKKGKFLRVISKEKRIQLDEIEGYIDEKNNVGFYKYQVNNRSGWYPVGLSHGLGLLKGYQFIKTLKDVKIFVDNELKNNMKSITENDIKTAEENFERLKKQWQDTQC